MPGQRRHFRGPRRPQAAGEGAPPAGGPEPQVARPFGSPGTEGGGDNVAPGGERTGRRRRRRGGRGGRPEGEGNLGAPRAEGAAGLEGGEGLAAGERFRSAASPDGGAA